MFKEFKEFAMRGNVVDMAVGIVIGASFGTIVTSFVNDIIMPPIGLLLGNVDFSGLFLILKAFANGCTALTGVEAISNGVQAFKTPASKNAIQTLLAMGLILGSMFL